MYTIVVVCNAGIVSVGEHTSTDIHWILEGKEIVIRKAEKSHPTLLGKQRICTASQHLSFYFLFFKSSHLHIQ